ncbi:hypothetical protein HFZ78_13260 [Priestia megaterium]|uniref:Uncharacterized protein n=1 Tax=Priestia megaterium TaxID=1404 RepID=A0A6H1P2S5_PRIMG|nr:hypothetical protein [Priestia megaterium]QIZ07581.1 hypothetical protein HFZ78_13260 [Priestia megaterium]
MKRKFIGERRAATGPQVRKPREVLYTIDEAIESLFALKQRKEFDRELSPDTMIFSVSFGNGLTWTLRM